MRKTRLHAPARANRARRSADVPANSNVPAHGERLHRVLAVEHHHKVRDVRTDLEAPADAAGRDARWRGPRAVWEASDDEP